jgi:hypothetical protein
VIRPRKDFEERGVDEQIIKLRYDHYKDRYNSKFPSNQINSLAMLMKIKDQVRFLSKTLFTIFIFLRKK